MFSQPQCGRKYPGFNTRTAPRNQIFKCSRKLATPLLRSLRDSMDIFHYVYVVMDGGHPHPIAMKCMFSDYGYLMYSDYERHHQKTHSNAIAPRNIGVRSGRHQTVCPCGVVQRRDVLVRHQKKGNHCFYIWRGGDYRTAKPAATQ